MEAIGPGPDQLVRSARLFDVYRPRQGPPTSPPASAAPAIRLELLDDDATLTDERVEAEVARLLERLRARLGVRLRA